jgi:putative heme-binding domain-containing protein
MMNRLVACFRWLIAVLAISPLFDLPCDAQRISLEQQLMAEQMVDLAADAREKGDPVGGAILFHSPGVGCGKCHLNSGGKRSLGPDLSSWKRFVDDLHLVESVLRPSGKVEQEYRSVQILTGDGRSVTGLVAERTGESLTLQTGVLPTDRLVIELDDVELEKQSDVSLMPSGQVNALRGRQEFLDLVAYLIAVRDGGPEVAKQLQPSEEDLQLRLPEYEADLDHRGMISEWNNDSLQRGQKVYDGLCVNCHGTLDKQGSLPTALRFGEGKFKFGNDPYSMYQTLTHGGGLMVPQTWMVPQQKYDVIHYLREHFLRQQNPGQFAKVTPAYLASLPKGDSRGPEPQVIQPFVTMDYGSMLITTIQFGDADNIAQKAIAIRLDEGPGGISRGQAWMVFEHDTMRMAAAWTDEFVDWNGIQFNGRHGVHLRASGRIRAAVPTGPGWADPKSGSFEDAQRVTGRDGRRYGPLPNSWAKFRGLHRYEDQVILDYTVGETEILERPGVVLSADDPVFARTLNVGPRKELLRMIVSAVPEDAKLESRGDGVQILRSGDQIFSAAVRGMDGHGSFEVMDGKLVLQIDAGEPRLQGNVVFSDSLISNEQLQTIDQALGRWQQDLTVLVHGGPAQYATSVEVPSSTWFESDAWAVDELVRPEGNPWSARTRVTGLDFYPSGDAMAVCTWDGDVWRVDGLKTIGESGSVLRWRRIASGLFQPLGILVEEDRVMVTCRDQLVALRDQNRDGEMDDYRCFNSDHQVTEHFHEFAMGLQRDAEGNYYYAKSARHALKAVVPHHGTLLKVLPDGSETEILAAGFRAANGVCLNDDGSFIVTDQEGHWNPKNRINWVRPGGFYGNMYGYHDVTDSSDERMQQPLCWITNSFDRSPAELLWAKTDAWGPLDGSLLNLSYGYGRIYVVPHEHVLLPSGERQPQGGMCQLPIPDLPTGMIRARFSPTDGQLYVGGMFSWAGSRQEQEGGLFRIRQKGNRVDLPIGLNARQDGVEISFSDPIDPKIITETDRFKVTVWDLKRTKNYGSKHFNERQLKVVSADLSADSKTVRLVIPELKPTWGMEIVCRLMTSDGNEVRRVIHNSIHQLSSK